MDPRARTVGPGWGAAQFTIFVKGTGFPSMDNTSRTKKGWIGIGQREKRMEGKKTRTLEKRKGAAPGPGFGLENSGNG